MNISKILLIGLIGVSFSVAVVGCSSEDGGVWQATVYDKQGGDGKVIGEYDSRDACQEAGVMHFAESKEEAHKVMSSKGLSINCALVSED